MRQAQPRSAFGLWMQAARPFSFTASITPVLLGTALAFFEQGSLDFWYGFLAVLGGLLLHAGTNLVSEYFDLKIGADTPSTYGSSRVLVENLMEPRRVFWGGVVAFGAASVIGLILIARFGWPILVLGLLGLVGGYFYTGSPLGYKYRALGEPLVFTLMGPLMVLGGWYVQTEVFSWKPILVSLPVGMLVAAILHANNLRDIADDTRAGFKTIATITGWRFTSWTYRLMVGASFMVLVGLVLTGTAPVWAMLSLLTFVPSLRLFRMAGAAEPMAAKQVATLDVFTAQLHFQFGILLTVGFILAGLLG